MTAVTTGTTEPAQPAQPAHSVGARPDATRAGHRRAMLAIARVEAVRLVRHPAVMAAAALLIGPLAYWAWRGERADRFPVLHEAARATQLGVYLLLGGAALIAANLAVLRPHRHRTAAVYDVLVLPARWRVGAHLIALLPVGLLAAVVVGARIGYQATLPGAVGRPSVAELATGPAAVLVLGATGVLLAGLVRSFVLAPVALLVVGATTYLTVVPTGFLATLRWFLPVVLGDEFFSPLPLGLSLRPAGRHLLYLVGLVAVLAVAALMRAGAGSRAGGPWRRLVPAATVALTLTVVAGAAQLQPPDAATVAARRAVTERPSQRQTCLRLAQVTYCAFAEFRGWVPEWDAVVRGVLRRVPPDVAAGPYAVRQRVRAEEEDLDGGTVPPAPVERWRDDDTAAGTPNAITADTRWGDDESALSLAALVAHEVVTHAGPGTAASLCGARAVLVGWLAAQASPYTRAGLRDLDSRSGGGVMFRETGFAGGPGIFDRELTVVHALLARPDDRVAALVLRHWAELSAHDTPAERVGEIFGVSVPPPPPDAEAFWCT